MPNRPLSRIFWRGYTALRYGSGKSHWQDVIPHLDLRLLTAKQSGMVIYRGETVSDIQACSKFDFGNEITIMGSGPSLKTQSLSNLQDHTCVLLNGAISLIGNGVTHPAAVMIEDERYIWHAFELMREKIPENTVCFFSPSVLRAICEADISWLKNKKLFLIENVLKPCRQSRRSFGQLETMGLNWTESQTVGFSSNPDTGIYPVGTVAYSAFQIVAAGKPARIGFAGIDLTDTEQPRFNEEDGNTAWSGLAENTDNILAGFKLGKAVAEFSGIVVENYSPTSALQQVGFGYTPRLEQLG